MTYNITFKRGGEKTLYNIVSVDYFYGRLHYSDSEATYTFDVNEVLHAECIGKSK